MNRPATEGDHHDGQRPWHEFRDSGLLWLMNRVVFHPRGYALALVYDGNIEDGIGICTGWQLMGDAPLNKRGADDGTEPWSIGVVVEVDRTEEVFAPQPASILVVLRLVHRDRTAEWEISPAEAEALCEGLMIETVR